MAFKRRVSEKTVAEVKRLIASGLSKLEAGKLAGITVGAVYYYTKDIPDYKPTGNRTLSYGAQLFLKELMEKGYCFLIDNLTHHYYRTLILRGFPIIRIENKGTSIYFLEGRRHEAMKAYCEKYESKVKRFGDIRKLERLFGVK